MSAGHHKNKDKKSAKQRASGKYLRAFVNCVMKTGRWRGKPANIADAKSGNRQGMLADLIARSQAYRK